MEHSKLMCNAKTIQYDFDKKTGTLIMLDGDCCDMSGCIAFFEMIDPDVRPIATISGTAPDTSYVRTGSGWVAHLSE